MTMPRFIISLASSGGVFSNTSFTAAMISSICSCMASFTSSAEIVTVFGSPLIRSRPFNSDVSGKVILLCARINEISEARRNERKEIKVDSVLFCDIGWLFYEYLAKRYHLMPHKINKFQIVVCAKQAHNHRTRHHCSSFTLPGTTWTMAAMVGQTSGLPLKLPFDGEKYYGNYSKMLPGAWTLGDILGEAGYHQVLMMGSDSSFAGRGDYFSQHGNYEINDYNK